MYEFNGEDPKILKQHKIARCLCKTYNDLDDKNTSQNHDLLMKLFNKIGEDVTVCKPFHCDIGKNIIIGSHVFINYNCVILDMTDVIIGDYTMIGPNVSIYTPYHSMDYLSRRKREGFAKKISIGTDCWIGGNVIILPGINIADGCVIGSGSTVTKDTKPYSLYVGNPAKFVKKINRRTKTYE